MKPWATLVFVNAASDRNSSKRPAFARAASIACLLALLGGSCAKQPPQDSSTESIADDLPRGGDHAPGPDQTNVEKILVGDRAAASDGGRSNRHALLIGCNKYEHLGELWQLHGPENDLVLFSRLLKDQFDFKEGDLTVLSDNAGDDRRPTYANIKREFGTLADQARPGDQIVILLAGHGTRQPDQNPPADDDPEPDGLDEVFLPTDAGKAADGGARSLGQSWMTS